MKKYLSSIALFSTLLFILSGCVSNEFGLSKSNKAPKKTSNLKPWAEQTNEDEGENIDVSDLDGEITESELGMVEEKSETKMKRIPFPTSEYSQYSTVGKGTIKGNIYVKNAYGEKVLGKGTRLYLNPVTSYSNQWYTESYVGGKKMEKADSRLFNYLKFTASDKQGIFAFYGVPSGSYYLIGTVECGKECGYETAKSIRIATRVSISGNNIVEQDLSRDID